MADKIDVPAWFERALDPSTPTTKDQETMRTASTYVEDLGGEVIYPTIRMNKAGRLYKPKDPLKAAIKNGDYILVEGPAGEETAMKATKLSKRMSAAVAEARKPVDRTDDLLKTQEDRMTSDTVSFNEGGLLDEGGTVDPVSGNDVPTGSTQKEVRDDIPAQLSEGEFVLPADVVRYIGLENLMELRNKAKQGLAQMEAMGQMGNSEEAIMDDTAEMEVDIDAMIDEFDPNDPATLEFNVGGSVQQPTYSYQPAQNIYGQQNYNPYLRSQQPQQFTTGYMPQTTYTPPPIAGPNAGQFTGAQPTGGAVEQRQYVGPNGELRTFTFIDGKPTEEIPAGFTVYKPEEQATPQVVKPTVSPVDTGGDGGGDGPDTDTSSEPNLGQTKADIDEALSAVNKDLAKAIEGRPKSFGEVVGKGIIGNLIQAIREGYYTQQAVKQVREGFGLTNPLSPEYQNFRNEMSTPMAASVARTEAEARAVSSGEQGLEGSSFGSRGEAEAVANSGWGSDDHFDAIDDQFSSLSETSGSSNNRGNTDNTAASEDANVGRGTDAANVDSGRGGMGPSGSGPSGGGGGGDDGGGQAGADAAGGASDSSPFAKGGLIEQTNRALKSSRKKK